VSIINHAEIRELIEAAPKEELTYRFQGAENVYTWKALTPWLGFI
jgi:hypothetical protein